MSEQNPKRQVVPPLTDHLYNKASRQKLPLSGTFELSPMCNFACRMCYVRKTAQEVAAHDRPMLTLEQWLDIARQVREAGTLFLLLTGGEPLLWPDFWPLYEALIHMGFVVSINTNGSLIDEAAVERFRKLPPKRISITLYGASDETYERLCGAKGVYSKVCRAIEGLQTANVPVKLSCSLTPYNVDDLEALVTYSETHKLVLDIASYMFPPLRRDAKLVGQNQRFTPEESAFYRLEAYRLQYGETKYHQFLQKIREGTIPPPGLDESCVDPIDGQIRCRAGKATYWITWDGWMTPCGMLPEPRVDLVGRDFSLFWSQLTDVSGGLRLSGVCSKCANQELCHACAAMAYTETGSFSGIPRYLCETASAMRKLAEEAWMKTL